MHTRDWKTNLKGQDLFSKIITIIKPKISTHKNIKKISKIKKNTKKKITIAAFPGLISARRTKVISKKQLRVSIAHTNLLKYKTNQKEPKQRADLVSCPSQNTPADTQCFQAPLLHHCQDCWCFETTQALIIL